MVKEIPMVWLQAAICSGCSVSLLNAQSPSIKNRLVDEVIPGLHINLRFHATVMGASGDVAIKVLENTIKIKKDGYFLAIEGAEPTRDGGAIGERDAQRVTMAARVSEVARDAMAILV
jgi:Ni,Fe-hydrogenase I small subunit